MRREDWNRKYAERELGWTEEPYRHLTREIAELEPGRALDLACGEGRHAILLAERGWNVLGVDFSDVAIVHARSRAATAGVDVDFRCDDVLAFEPERHGFDLVLVCFLQLPSHERRLVLSRAAAAVAPGGTLLLVGHDLLNLSEGVGGPSDPEVLFTPADVVSELPGLEIERAERVFRDVRDTDRLAIDAFVRARRRAA